MEHSKQRSAPNLISRFLWGLREAFPTTKDPSEGEIMLPPSPNPISSDLELSCRAGNLVLGPEQIQELCDFIDEARHNRDRRIPDLESSLSEANAALTMNAKEGALLVEKISQLEASLLLAQREIPLDRISCEQFAMATTATATETTKAINKNHNFSSEKLADSSLIQSETQDPPLEEEDPRMSEIVQQLSSLETENKRMKETLERYEVAVAMYKGDRHMLLTDALRKAFTSPNYRLLTEANGARQHEETSVGTTTCVETEAAGTESVQPEESKESETIIDSEPGSGYTTISTVQLKMMQGCWMYKYPRRRYHRLINLPCVPLAKLTYRFFWFCPANKCVMWREAGSSWLCSSVSSCKIVMVKDVICEGRTLDKGRSSSPQEDGKVQVIVVIPESGLPLALIPTSPDDYHIWKMGLYGTIEKPV